MPDAQGFSLSSVGYLKREFCGEMVFHIKMMRVRFHVSVAGKGVKAMVSMPLGLTIIAGLGNPEKDYKNTRHNIGFEVINQLSRDQSIALNKVKFRAHVGEGKIHNRPALLLKPQTYMNLSGESIRDALRFYKLGPENLIVIYDDCDLDIGELRIRKKGGAGTHNGMKNILYHLESEDFIRIRVGIGQKPPRYDLADYVLSRFKPNELEKITQGIESAAEAVAAIFSQGIDNAMNRYNKRKEAPGERSSFPS